jgi:hypothetical protein
MYNKKLLKTVTGNLDKAKAPVQKKDMPFDPSGKGMLNPDYAGKPVRLATDTLYNPTPYTINAYADNGMSAVLNPFDTTDVNFPGAQYVDEYPSLKKGGSKKNSKSLLATNRLYKKNPLFKKPKYKSKTFDPSAMYFEDGGFIDAELTQEEIDEYRKGGYIVQDISVPELNQAKQGGALLTKKVTCKKCGWKWDAADGGSDITTCHKCGGQGLIHAQVGVTVDNEEPKRRRFVPGTYNPETTVGYVEELPEAQAEAKAPEWLTYAREYEKKKSKEDFINDKKRDYLKSNTGLNKAAGVTMDNFPETVEQNFADEYEYKRNSYVAKRYGKKHGFNPKRRGEWVEQLSPGTEAVIANSKYGSKLQPSYWSRAAAGIQNLQDMILPGEQPYVQIDGLTKKEQKEILNSKLGALETLAPLDIPGAALANYLKNRGISTGFDYRELPGVASGQKMSNVSDLDAMGLNPMNLVGLEGIGEMGINLVKGAKALPGAVKASKESGLLSNLTGLEGGRAASTIYPVETPPFVNTTPPVQINKAPWKVEEIPGLHLKSTMSEGPISKIVEPKTGLINTEQALAIIAKESGGKEKVEIIKAGLGDNIPKKMDYNDFRKTVQQQIVPLEIKVKTGIDPNYNRPYGSYGIDNIGYDINSPDIKTSKIELGNKDEFGLGSDAHGSSEETLGHIHTLEDADEPGVIYATQKQADAFQSTYGLTPSQFDEKMALKNLNFMEKKAAENVTDAKNAIQIDADTYQLPDGIKVNKKVLDEMLGGYEDLIKMKKAELKNFKQKKLLSKDHEERYLQEFVNYASQRPDINRIRIPTYETAAEIQRYGKRVQTGDNTPGFSKLQEEISIAVRQGDQQKVDELMQIHDEILDTPYKSYSPEHQTILKKYSKQPEIIKKLYGVEPKVVNDRQGNTWYEFNIPYEFKDGPREIKAFKKGGALDNSMELELSLEEIKDYLSRGYVIEEIH